MTVSSSRRRRPGRPSGRQDDSAPLVRSAPESVEFSGALNKVQVHARVLATGPNPPVVRPGGTGNDPNDLSPAAGQPDGVLRRSARAERVTLGAIVVLGLAAVAGAPTAAILGVGAIVGLSALRSRMRHHLDFGFGDGFVGYRPRADWPRGVQEDDDFKWSWRGPAT